MTNDQDFPEDDKTRIGMGVEFFSPDKKPQPSPTPVNDSEKTRIGPGIDINRPAPPPPADTGFDSPQRPRFAEEQTSRPQAPVAPPPRPVAPKSPVREEDLLFEAEMANGAVEMPLSSGHRLTVGRDTTQDIILDDRTLSREHLVLERRGDKVIIQVLGLNGLVHNGINHKSTTIEIAAPASFTVGRILCRLRKKVDTNATLFMADPAEFAKAQQKQPTPPSRDPFAGHPPPRGGDFRQPAPPPPFPGGDFPGESPTPQPEPSPSFPSASSGNAFDDFEGQNSWEDPFSQTSDGGLKSGFSSQKAGIGRYLMIGGAALLGILIIVTLVLFFTREKDEPRKSPATAPPVAQQAAQPPVAAPAPAVAPPPAPTEPAQTDGDPKNYNLHGRFFNEAYRYYNEGNFTMACDYLKDIPATSAFRERAENLAKQMGNCKLND
ncbi:MAG: FHA domain-containing protein [Pseudomonadota bacterium]